MKKKFIALGVLVAAVAVTASSVAGTYAKYTTTGSELTDKARVAKWKLGVPTEIKDLFSESYNDGAIAASSSATDLEDATDDGVIAPGAKGHYTFELTGEAPEVAYQLNGTITVVDNTKKLKFYLADGAYSEVNFSSSAEQFKDAASFDATEFFTNKKYAANTPINGAKFTLYWMWDFNGNTEDDNKLGNGDTTDYTTSGAEAVKVTAQISAEQIASMGS